MKHLQSKLTGRSEGGLQEIPNNYDGKIELVREILLDIRKRKDKHYKMYRKYKKRCIITKAAINALNAVSVCSLVLSFTPISPAVGIIAITTTSLSSILSAISSSVDIETKTYSHNTSYLQYTDIYRDVKMRLLKNGLSSEDLDSLLNELNQRLGLIEDCSLPITVKNK